MSQLTQRDEEEDEFPESNRVPPLLSMLLMAGTYGFSVVTNWRDQRRERPARCEDK